MSEEDTYPQPTPMWKLDQMVLNEMKWKPKPIWDLLYTIPNTVAFFYNPNSFLQRR